MPSEVAVLGAGVIGLAVGVRLLEELKDVDVTVYADVTGNETTSRGSGGLWMPYSLGLLLCAKVLEYIHRCAYTTSHSTKIKL